MQSPPKEAILPVTMNTSLEVIPIQGTKTCHISVTMPEFKKTVSANPINPDIHTNVCVSGGKKC